MSLNFKQKLLSIKKIKQLLKNRQKSTMKTYNTKIFPLMRKMENNIVQEVTTTNNDIINNNVISNDSNKINNNNSTNNNINIIPKNINNEKTFIFN